MPVLRRLTPLTALVAVTVAFIILPIASSAFLGDDQFNSTVNGLLGQRGISVVALAWETALGFLHQTSRFVPGFYFQAYGLFHLVPGLAAYKAVQITLFAFDVVLLVALLRALALDAALTALAVLFVLLSVQFHGHYDGYLGFSATNPYWLALALGSWLAFALALRGENRRRELGISIALFVVAVLNYETCYPLSVGHALIAMHLRGRDAWRAAWPFLAVTVLALVQIGITRILIPQPPTAEYSLHLVSFAYFRTVFYQMTASLPLAYLTFYHRQIFPPGVGFWSVVPAWLLICVAAASGAAAFHAIRGLAFGPIRRLLLPAALGAWLWAEAALLLAAIPRYQVEVSPGYGYIPMVLGGFGAAIVLACALAAIVGRVPERRRTAVAAGFAALYALALTASFETNERTLAIYQGERSALINLSDALDSGLASGVPDGSVLLIDSPMQLMGRFSAMQQNTAGLDNPHFFVREHSGRSLRVRAVHESPSPIDCNVASCAVSATYALRDVPLDVRDGFTVLGIAARVGRAPDGTLRPLVTDMLIHIRGDRLGVFGASNGLAVAYACSAGGEKISRLSLTPSAIRSGATVRLVPPCLADIESLRIAGTAARS